MDAVDILWRLGVVALLILINGFFVAAEFALVSVRPTRLDELVARGNRAAQMVRRAQEDPNHFIATAQLGITVASLLLGWIGEETVATLLLLPMAALLPPAWVAAGAHTVATLLALVLITLFHVTLGEQVPKLIALQRGERTILFSIRPVEIVARVFRPFIALLYVSTTLALKVLGLRYQAEEQAVHSPDELQLLIRRSALAGEIVAGEREMLDRVFGFADLAADEVMIPRTEVVGVPVEASVDEALAVALRHRHSRFPVYEGSLDNVVGVLLVKDLLALSSQPRRPDIGVRRLMRAPVFIPATLPAIEVLARMKAARAPLAVVLDEFGGTDGIVTLKDLVERVVGDVGDEYVAELPDIRPQPDGSLQVDGLTLVDDFNERSGSRLDTSEVATLGGLAMARLGRIAELGDEVDLGEGYRARVERLDGRRVAELRIWPPSVQEPAEDGAREAARVAESDGSDLRR